MITYNPREWFKLIFNFHKSDTLRTLTPSMFIVGLFTAIVIVLEKIYVKGEYPGILIFHQISGFVLSLILVFRINTAYDRWWEGRKLWGQLVNTCKNLSLQLHVILPEEDFSNRKEAHRLISNFPFALKEHLRNDSDSVEDIHFSEFFNRENYNKASHKPGLVCSKLTELCLMLTNDYPKSQNSYLIMSGHLAQLMDICGGCERIKNTPIPYAYSMYIKKIIFIYVFTMALVFGLVIGYVAIPVVMILFYAFAALEIISEEIEDPFGKDANDLPTDELAVKIKNQTSEILMSDAV